MKKIKTNTFGEPSSHSPGSAIDRLDFHIMQHLIEDGRKSLTDIAKALNISVGTARNRLSRLMDEDVFMVFGQVDPNRIGFNAYAQIFIAIRPVNRLAEIAAQIAAFPEVSFVAQIAGEFDLEINVMCRDNNHLTTLMNERLYKIDGIHQTKTNMYLQVFKVAQPDLQLLHSAGEES